MSEFKETCCQRQGSDGVRDQTGEKIGQILQKLLEEVLEEPDKNKKEYLLERVKQTYQ